MTPTLAWLRRDLRLHDHAALARAEATGQPVQPVFVFDTDILSRFPNRQDRRLSFIAAALCGMEKELSSNSGGILALHGSAREIMPRLARALEAHEVVAAADYEPATRQRDKEVGRHMASPLTLVKDQLVFSPEEITRGGAAYKVYTPYAKAWRAALQPSMLAPFPTAKHFAVATAMRKRCEQAGFKPLTLTTPAALLSELGYDYREDALWPAESGPFRLHAFMRQKANDYKVMRDYMAADGTSRLSPYIRFGLISVRECVKAALEAKADTWLSELIWREFYAMTLFFAPESAQTEWNPRYREKLRWLQDPTLFTAWAEGKTGYPVVDAAMRQLLQEGWMHNRARMIVASFLTKHLRTDWRLGEAHFSQYLMDYDLASNVGGWQWAASTGTDAQPYFRVFNPVLQSQKFDPEGDYIRAFVPELAEASATAIHAPWKHSEPGYISPVVVHEKARQEAIAMFKNST